ncbi:MAG TPA: site-specific integrase [Candidatus Pullichristensenella avicola]|nr:site-specific integrase [Candidatus Pullichristensenella avicola]
MLAEEWLNTWLSLRAGGLRPRTVDSYSGLIRLHIVPVIGKTELTAISAPLLAECLARVARKGHHRTAEQCYVLLRSAMRSAVLLGWLTHSPMDAVMRPAHDPRPGAAWSPEECREYLAVALNHRHQMAWVLALLFGLRRGEIVGLRWSDISLQTRSINIQRQLVSLANGTLVEQPPKTRAGRRTLPIPDELLPIFRKNWRFGSSRVVPLTPNGLDQSHSSLLRRLNLPYIRLHDLRHTMATNAIRNGASMRALSDVLGHADPSITAKFYTHPDRQLLNNAIAAASNSWYT